MIVYVCCVDCGCFRRRNGQPKKPWKKSRKGGVIRAIMLDESLYLLRGLWVIEVRLKSSTPWPPGKFEEERSTNSRRTGRQKRPARKFEEKRPAERPVTGPVERTVGRASGRADRRDSIKASGREQGQWKGPVERPAEGPCRRWKGHAEGQRRGQREGPGQQEGQWGTNTRCRLFAARRVAITRRSMLCADAGHWVRH